MLGLHPLPSLAQPMEFCQAQILRFAQHNNKNKKFKYYIYEK
jgi:hypothetical protein